MTTPMGHRLLSEPVKVIWAGFESDTYKLQRCGWQISAREPPYGGSIGVAIQHPELQVQGVSDVVGIDCRSTDYGRYKDRMLQHMYPLVFNMQIAQHVQIHMTLMDMERVQYRPIDATPTYVEDKIGSLDELAVFQSMPKPEADIILAPPSFNEILQMALDHQAPKQKELREKARRTLGSGAILRVAA